MIPYNVLLAIVVLVVGGAAGVFLFKKDTEKENRRKAAMRLAGAYRNAGLINTAELLEDYAVGDYSGMGKKIHQAAALLDNVESGEKFLKDLVDRVKAAVAPDAPAAK